MVYTVNSAWELEENDNLEIIWGLKLNAWEQINMTKFFEKSLIIVFLKFQFSPDFPEICENII